LSATLPLMLMLMLTLMLLMLLMSLVPLMLADVTGAAYAVYAADAC
jgi:hypothetical protein